MPKIDTTAVLQTIPLLAGIILIGIYARRCSAQKRKFDYETVFLCFADCIAITSAVLLVLAAYFSGLRPYISDLGIYIAISGIVVGHMAWTSLRKRIFFPPHGKLTEEQTEIDSIVSARFASSRLNGSDARDLLIVVDLQRDFCHGGALETPNADSLVPVINELIRSASRDGCVVVLSRDWHPSDHKSFSGNGGLWPSHCVRGTPGADFPPQLDVSPSMQIVDIGHDNAAPDYSAFDDPRLQKLASETHLRTIYVVGIALEYCVLATCLDALRYGAPVVALEPLIRSATTDPSKLEAHWKRLNEAGVIRAHNYAPRPTTRPNGG
jgi:nicotinamidase/pyrazinamidase